MNARVFLLPSAVRLVQAPIVTPLDMLLTEVYGDRLLLQEKKRHVYELVRVIDALGDGLALMERMDGSRFHHRIDGPRPSVA